MLQLATSYLNIKQCTYRSERIFRSFFLYFVLCTVYFVLTVSELEIILPRNKAIYVSRYFNRDFVTIVIISSKSWKNMDLQKNSEGNCHHWVFVSCWRESSYSATLTARVLCGDVCPAAAGDNGHSLGVLGW